MKFKLKFKLHTVRTIAIWTLISISLQLCVYTVLNNSIAKVMNPPVKQSPGQTENFEPAETTTHAVLPDANPTNVQLSYSNTYLAYTANGVLKVYDLKSNKVVFEKKPDSGSDKNLGFLNYQWLADRNSLIYFYAKKNPAKKTSSPVKTSPVHEDYTGAEDPKEDSKAENGSSSVKENVQVNSQITELNTLDLPESSSASPNDRHGIDLSDFPDGGQILQIASSTCTNLIYVTIKTGTSVKLMQIDIMKDTKFIKGAGDTVTNIVTSDRYGTLYVESKSGKTKQILALNGTQSKVISKNSDYVILGVRDGSLYIGEVNNNSLVKILCGTESSDNKKNMELSQCWQGDVPYNGHVIIGSEGQVIVYNNQNAHIIHNGKVDSISFDGIENFVSSDGAKQIQFTRDGSQIMISMEPIKLSLSAEKPE